MLEVRSLTRRFPGLERPALDAVSFRVSRGDCLVISGANGSGKSVLMNLIAGLDRPTDGSVEVAQGDGKPYRVGLVFQDANAQILGDTPEEDAAFGPRNMGHDGKRSREIARAALGRVGLSGLGNVPARSLSGGEKRRLAVAGILAMDAEIIIFDEPFANLDWPGVLQVNAVIKDLKIEGKTIIVLTHELEKVLALANRLLVLFAGKLVYDGTPSEALSGAVSLEAWGIRNPLNRYETLKDLVWEADR
ncbi:MAG TPA: ABC transporter ATP-binding protein [Treponemataceae bacterium]|nr:ABC transporter ATP-binding protein [Treponemataceae bacterium]HPS43120.1 ABC transporter ATP-binding protein [Treponemataceae bacterium]